MTTLKRCRLKHAKNDVDVNDSAIYYSSKIKIYYCNASLKIRG